MPKDHNGDKFDRDRGNGLRGRPQGRFSGKSRAAPGLAAAAALLCLIAPALPAWAAGDARATAVSLVLSFTALATGLAAWLLRRGKETQPGPWAGDAPGLALIESAAAVLREQVNTIRGFSEVLTTGAATGRAGAEVRNSCRFILENSESLASFLGQLHDFARYEQGRLGLAEQQVEAADLIAAALGPCRPMAEAADVVIVATLLEGVELRCDAARIGQSIASLVLWAAGTAPADRTIRVGLAPLDGGGASITVSCAARSFGAMEAQRLFEPQIAPAGLGGMALPIARRVALLHSGDLTIENDAGGGVTARLSLPAQRVTWPGRDRTSGSRAA